MRKFLFCFIFFLNSCNETAFSIDNKKNQLQEIEFDVVEKKLILDENLPLNLKNYIYFWFDNKVKIDGFNGNMTFSISDYNQEIININDGKRVNISLNFNVILNKPLLSKKKIIKGEVKSFGELTGTFSLNDFDILIENTQLDLIERLNIELKQKI